MKKIILFGTGTLSKFLTKSIIKEEVTIVAYVDGFNFGHSINGIPVISEEDIRKFVFDYIIIAFSNVRMGRQKLLNLGIQNEKIVAYNPSGDQRFLNELNEEISQRMHEYLHDDKISSIFHLEPLRLYLNTMSTYKNYNNIIHYDYVREQTLALLSEEIERKKVPGCVVELGVYKGEFSCKINELFPNRKLYLFDTFEGFNIQDLQSDGTVLDIISENHKWKDTGVDQVLTKMKFPEQCIVKKGYFPETFDLTDINFSFVSIDVDLYNPIKAGLEIFYPLLSPGGYIMIHDYNALGYEGTKKAVYEFCNQNQISFVPICDVCGSIVITK